MLTSNSQRSSNGFVKKMVVAAATVLSAGIVAAAPAIANPEPSDTHPTNPFGGLTCSCQETIPAGSTGRNSELDRGIQAGSHGQALTNQPIQ
jgi:hypothetical protein